MNFEIDQPKVTELNNKFKIKESEFNFDKRVELFENNKLEINKKIFNIDERLSVDNTDKIKECLKNFVPEIWFEFDEMEMAKSILDLRNLISKDLQLENPPEIEFYEKNDIFEYGFYSSEKNIIGLNFYNFDNPIEVAKTIIHELRHKWQEKCIALPEDKQNEFDKVLKFNDENYVSPEDNYKAYWMQPMEIDAREYAGSYLKTLDGLEL